ncbi:UCH domain-containing protein/zf-MYND domain-containing protein [Cephalotus follicularis]|uniref:UCH domain-containing protein/zf-MYND domain-containing protein n=1 Tax=Cephalotus follicularis TaxID=3775 RepID=A0A1Q3CC80_CEPFO|nr:UCH domain-containing protein/zf-MYND domain-containing protein [Cephalotus follicularis]
MHVAGISTVDLKWLVQLVFTVFVVALGLLHLVKNTASKYFEVDANFDDRSTNQPMPLEPDDAVCASCGISLSKMKKCSRCKSVLYCSSKCQQTHWNSGHKSECKDSGKVNSTKTAAANLGFKASKSFSGIALVPASGSSKLIKKPGKVLFPYDEFVKLYNWDKPGFSPCGLLNCGNSCFANVVLQCLTYTRPLVAYLLEKGHRRECRRNDWCFLCEFQAHVERASQSQHPFSPISILSRLPNIGGNLGYGRQEDAHEFMRFAIDTMQSVCLDEFGGEKAVNPSSQETTLIQHIFGGHLQSQVICTKCNRVSNQYENMMDLTVEIHGDVASLEECLDQFTTEEWLHGENMYKCDGCNDYVKACKRLTIRRAPNILTIALKRFQSGRFGKLNKRVTFPETLDLSSYMSKEEDGTHLYKLYAVVVHVDMLNASFFGHYICYTKDFCGNWYRIDDCKVTRVGLEEVLSEGAYMLLYNRVCARPSCLRTIEPLRKEQQKALKMEAESCTSEQAKTSSMEASKYENKSCSEINARAMDERSDDIVVVDSSSSVSKVSSCESNPSFANKLDDVRQDDLGLMNCFSSSSGLEEVYGCHKDATTAFNFGATRDPKDEKVYSGEEDGIVFEVVKQDLEDVDMENSESHSFPPVDTRVCSSIFSSGSETSPSRPHCLKRESPSNDLVVDLGNGAKRAEVRDDSMLE